MIEKKAPKFVGKENLASKSLLFLSLDWPTSRNYSINWNINQSFIIYILNCLNSWWVSCEGKKKKKQWDPKPENKTYWRLKDGLFASATFPCDSNQHPLTHWITRLTLTTDHRFLEKKTHCFFFVFIAKKIRYSLKSSFFGVQIERSNGIWVTIFTGFFLLLLVCGEFFCRWPLCVLWLDCFLYRSFSSWWKTTGYFSLLLQLWFFFLNWIWVLV